MLELQSAFARAVGDGLHAPVVSVARAVEHHAGDARRPRLLGEELAGGAAPPGLPGAGRLDAFARVAHAEEGDSPGVVHQLGVHVLERAEDHQPGTLGRPAHLPPHPEVTALPSAGPVAGPVDRAHGYFAPVLPALRRTVSPWYRMPLPL